MPINKIDSIYLDNNATTACDPKVVEKMLPFFTNYYGNPSNGLHRQGRISFQAIEDAREKVAVLIGANPKEIFFSSGATESNNLAILGCARNNKNLSRKKIITIAIEHKAVLDTCKELEKEGFEIIILPVSNTGLIQIDTFKQYIDEKTLIVTIQAANNEVGTIQPIKELAEITHSFGAIFHSDAAQAIGKFSLNVEDQNLDMISFSSHKLYGPKGIGSLYLRGGTRGNLIQPIMYGGGQENSLRPGTSNTPAIVGFGEACSICSENLENEYKHLRSMRDVFEAELISKNSSIIMNGKSSRRIPNTSNLTFPGVDADALILNSQRIMIGTGSACNSGAIEPSHVLSAMGISRDMANSSIRISFGRFNNSDDPLIASNELLNAYNRLLSFK